MHLLKGLYGAKQAGRLWNKMLDASLKRRGFKVTTHDPCMYIKFMPGGRRLMVLGYVDDCAITGDSDVEIEEPSPASNKNTTTKLMTLENSNGSLE
jgi:hypothetical protein